MKKVGFGFREGDLVTRNEKRSLFSKGRRFYLNQSLATVYIEGQDVETKAVALGH